MLFLLGCKEKKDFISFYNQFLELRNGDSNLSYEIDYKFKSFNSKKFQNRSATVLIEKNPLDSLFGANYIIDLDSVKYIYNGFNLFRLSEGNVIKVDMKKYPNAFVNSNIEKSLLMNSFIESTNLINQVESDSELTMDTFLITKDGKEYLSFKINFEDTEILKNQKLECQIDLKSNIVSSFEHEVQYLDGKQISISDTRRIDFDDDYFQDFMNGKFLQSAKPVAEFRPDEEDEIDVIGRIIEFKGYNFTSKDSFDIINDDAKFKVLDFYFSSCFPCIKSVEEINNIILSKEFDNISFYGLNYIDNKVRKNASIEKFITQHKMKYPTILIDKKVNDSFQAQVYPTIVILNEKNEVVYHHLGHNGELNKVLKSLLQEY